MEVSNDIQQCPSCSRVIRFTHNETSLLQCECGTVISRKAGKLSTRPVLIIQNAYAFIQCGTEGQWNQKEFTVLGRFRCWFKDSVFNYWTISFVDGSLAYLAESYGIYAIYYRIPNPLPAGSKLNKITLSGSTILLGMQHFLLEYKSLCTLWEIEGELYLPECKSNFDVFEFSSSNQRHITLFDFLDCNDIAFEVYYVSYSQLKLTNTKTDKSIGKTINCDDCYNPFPVQTFPFAKSFVCPFCAMGYSMELYKYKKEKRLGKDDGTPIIRLGSCGLVKNVCYEVIGFAIKEENNSENSRWKEYTLHNPEEGFAFLSEYHGHWIYAREKGDSPVLPTEKTSSFEFDKKPFQLFNRYSYKIIAIAGEFPYNIFDVSNVCIKEFISPPHMWIRERESKSGTVSFLGEHISGKEMKLAFKGKVILPNKMGIGAIEPKSHLAVPKLMSTTLIAVLILIFVHLLTTFIHKEEVIFERNFKFSDSASSISFVTDKFHLNKWRSNIEFVIYAPVDNSWFALEANLVDKITGKEYSIQKGIEYYHGYTDGEGWTEGNNVETAFLNLVPAGDYILQLEGTRENSAYLQSKIDNFQVKMIYDVAEHENFFICLGLLLIWPVIRYVANNNIEKRRWYNSPLSPY